MEEQVSFTVRKNRNGDSEYERCPDCRIYIPKGTLTIHRRRKCLFYKPDGSVGCYYIRSVKKT